MVGQGRTSVPGAPRTWHFSTIHIGADLLDIGAVPNGRIQSRTTLDRTCEVASVGVEERMVESGPGLLQGLGMHVHSVVAHMCTLL